MRPINTKLSASKKAFYTSLAGNTELQSAIFRYLSRDRDRRPSSFTQEDGEAEKECLQKLCKLFLAFYRFVSHTVADDNKSGRSSFTLASVAKDVEKSKIRCIS